MEKFFYEENFYLDIGDFMDYNDFLSEEDVEALPSDWYIKVQPSQLEPLFKCAEDFIVDALMNEVENRYIERFPEDCDPTFDKVKKAFLKGIDLEKINEAMPKLNYPTGNFETITKADLLEYIK